MTTETRFGLPNKKAPGGLWEQRWHPLREEWVIIAAHRQNRPWSGETHERGGSAKPQYVEDCYLCPRNERVGGAFNPDYTDVYVFDNDHPSVGAAAPAALENPPGIYQNRPAGGLARVVCYSPKHNLSLAEMSCAEIAEVVAAWQRQYAELGRREDVESVLIFENKGEVVGVSNPHPHGQIYATNFVFKTIDTEIAAGRKYLKETGRVLFADIIESEQADGRRIIYENEHAIVFVPYFARYAYEVYAAPKKSHQSVAGLSAAEVADFAEALKNLLVRYDNLWQMSFPYIMLLHDAPTKGGIYEGFHFHIQFHPPLRKPNLLKYLGGPETGGGNFLSDTSPEEKAAELKAQSGVHYAEELTA